MANDYYNGINLAFLLNILANLEDNKLNAFIQFSNANRIRNKVIKICNDLSESKTWEGRDDQEWIYLTLAEAFFAIGDTNQEFTALAKASLASKGSFAIDSYLTQKEKLNKLITDFKSKYKIDEKGDLNL